MGPSGKRERGERLTAEIRPIYTIGHSTRSLEELLALLTQNGVSRLVDIRTVPRSRRHPHFNREVLARTLPEFGLGYEHLAELGGLRRPRADSPNTAWRNTSFRGYADYLGSQVFECALAHLLTLATREQVAIMCAEAVPWRCHRSLVADALLARSVPVEHIIGLGRRQPHRLTPFARLEGERLTYPAAVGDDPAPGGPD